MIMYFVLVSPPVKMENIPAEVPFLASSKVIKPLEKPVEESNVYHHAPTKWVKISKKI